MHSDAVDDFDDEGDCSEGNQIVKSDANVITFLRFCSKCFACGVDEKSGCFSDFKTYCEPEKNHFISFRGNRFNIIFLMGQIAYFHKNQIENFLENVHGANNFVQKTTLKLCKQPVILAECKAIGLLSKIVTGPLWRIIEQNNHVLDMNSYYESLLDYFRECSEDAAILLAENIILLMLN